jgi:hypothetical protein
LKKKIISSPASTMIIRNGCSELLFSHGDSACFTTTPQCHY